MKIKIQKGYIGVYGNSLPLILARSFYKNAKVTVFPPFIFFINKSYERDFIVNHEKIHFRQYYELLFIFIFIIQYFEYYYAKYFLKKNDYEAYIYTTCEQEAYLNHNNPNYLKERKIFSVFKYMFNKKNFTYNRETGEVKIV